jgi:hypothetical protein
VSTTKQVACGWSQASLRLKPEYGIELSKYGEQTLDVLRTTRINKVYVVGLDWSAVQDGGEPTDHDELATAFLQFSQSGKQSTRLHSKHELPKYPRYVLPRTAGVLEE